jgi:hypothetical protein
MYAVFATSRSEIYSIALLAHTATRPRLFGLAWRVARSLLAGTLAQTAACTGEALSLRMNRIEACGDPSLNRAAAHFARGSAGAGGLMRQSTHPLRGGCAAVASAPARPSGTHHYLPSNQDSGKGCMIDFAADVGRPSNTSRASRTMSALWRVCWWAISSMAAPFLVSSASTMR